MSTCFAEQKGLFTIIIVDSPPLLGYTACGDRIEALLRLSSFVKDCLRRKLRIGERDTTLSRSPIDLRRAAILSLAIESAGMKGIGPITKKTSVWDAEKVNNKEVKKGGQE